MPDVSLQVFAQDISQLRTAAALITEFVSNHILDPHWGFQNTFSGPIHCAETPAELLQLISRLIETLDIIGFSEPRLQQLEAILAKNNIPPLAALRPLC